MKILFVSDLHGVDYFSWQNFLQIDESKFDIIITLGDIDIMFLKSIKDIFKNKKIIGVHGNHDYEGDLEYCNIENIHGKSIKFKNIIISGLGGCLKYKEHPLLYTDREVVNIIENFNINSDIIASHNSPLGIHDNQNITHRGFWGLKEYIKENNPKYCIHGHQHKNQITKYENTVVIGVHGGIILDFKTGKIELILNSD